MKDSVIELKNISKRYGFFGSRSYPWALRDISLKIARGEVLGVIGPNGAGKSTLLKILAGVSPPTKGKTAVKGKVFSMIELNAGLHPEFTGRENVYLLGAIMGLSRSFIKNKMTRIEEFCEIGQYFDKPVRTYSDGMLARLGFAVAVNVKADILLIDEVLAVGDLNFQNKCLRKIKQLKESQDATIIFVSHNLDMVQYLCQRAIILDKGSIIKDGPADESITYYENKMHYLESKSTLPGKAYLTGKVKLNCAYILDNDGQRVSQIDEGGGFSVNFEGAAVGSVSQPLITFAIQNAKKEHCIFEIFECDLSQKPLTGAFCLSVKVPPLPLSGGCYTVNFSIRDKDGYLTYARYHYVTSFVVQATKRERGMLAVPVTWELKTESGNFRGNIDQ
jgi:ABC-type polysaccharide/polyol phosphate transport system ATPase subunit